MAYNPPVAEVKHYAHEHNIGMFAALKALRKAHRHTPRPNVIRFAMCSRGHVAGYQRYCEVCGAKYCTLCQK